jgi:hypothetical protein
MAKRKKFFKKLYSFDGIESQLDFSMNTLLMVGKKNWTFYFSSAPSRVEKEMFVEENISFVECDSEKELFEYLDTVEEERRIDFSFEHNKPCALIAEK